MNLSPESILAAKKLTLPDTEEIFILSDWDRDVWQAAFDWYNKAHSPDKDYKMSCKPCYSKVYTALKKAQCQ